MPDFTTEITTKLKTIKHKGLNLNQLNRITNSPEAWGNWMLWLLNIYE